MRWTEFGPRRVDFGVTGGGVGSGLIIFGVADVGLRMSGAEHGAWGRRHRLTLRRLNVYRTVLFDTNSLRKVAVSKTHSVGCGDY